MAFSSEIIIIRSASVLHATLLYCLGASARAQSGLLMEELFGPHMTVWGFEPWLPACPAE